MNNTPRHTLFNVTVIVAALGYFVDIYDLLLFGIIRIPSLQSLGLTPEQVKLDGEIILQWQMWGLLLGGIISGVIGDKRGRLSVLFGSIILYSAANIANGFVETVEQYKWIRFVAGLGLAGELGAGITLVSEVIPKQKRGLATSFVAGIGLTGAILAYFMKQQFDWRTCYFIGGGLGIALLLLRISVLESSMFHQVKEQKISRGNFFLFFTNLDRFKRYLFGILIGLPTWYVIGILVTFSNDFALAFGITEKIDPGKAIMFAYAGISLGDILIGLVSQWLRSRTRALYIFYGITMLFMVLYFTILWQGSAATLYLVCAGLGFGTGFWAIFVTMGAEQFGTNLRATAATTIPNMVRGMLAIFILPMFKWLQSFPSIGYINAGIISGVIIMAITWTAALLTKETFHKDLEFIEE
ncbi:MAG: MFS transporter [Chitinophagales bacterium]|jgi:MFS family permease|nr:MFS transporter [Chitinophagales bacterium]